ncbi:TPA: D-glycero-beta-D-manno-heptose 1,7-bisphosphate 7-phosphatase [Campylobacter fetus]|nr:D-glycero-beta-D-manno-heptose 1,7-bisphosphate 7-phosphatase [Campylobacter fetus]HDX8138758.1 D-glycero-beta-D-manno-heptose 1,7-bisphosphate 7-phosphatase [Campylobacter fetus]
MKKIKAVFLDRDGVINKDLGYVSKIDDFEFCDGIFEALCGFLKLGFALFIVTNQSGIGRGYYTSDDFLNLTKFMLDEFKKEDIYIKKVYYCPHSPEENCDCRKPKPGMILKALSEFDINLKNSIMIGDKNSDMLAANSAGINNCYLIGETSSLKTALDVYKLVFKECI